MHVVHDGGGHFSPRLTYAVVVGALSIVAAVALFPPLKYVFMAWPVDVVL